MHLEKFLACPYCGGEWIIDDVELRIWEDNSCATYTVHCKSCLADGYIANAEDKCYYYFKHFSKRSDESDEI